MDYCKALKTLLESTGDNVTDIIAYSVTLTEIITSLNKDGINTNFLTNLQKNIENIDNNIPVHCTRQGYAIYLTCHAYTSTVNLQYCSGDTNIINLCFQGCI